jgi:hypothetical protein
VVEVVVLFLWQWEHLEFAMLLNVVVDEEVELLWVRGHLLETILVFRLPYVDCTLDCILSK